jgi:hypothetical protein
MTDVGGLNEVKYTIELSSDGLTMTLSSQIVIRVFNAFRYTLLFRQRLNVITNTLNPHENMESVQRFSDKCHRV